MNVTGSLWVKHNEHHSSQIGLNIVGNLYAKNRAYNSFLGSVELSTLSIITCCLFHVKAGYQIVVLY